MALSGRWDGERSKGSRYSVHEEKAREEAEKPWISDGEIVEFNALTPPFS